MSSANTLDMLGRALDEALMRQEARAEARNPLRNLITDLAQERLECITRWELVERSDPRIKITSDHVFNAMERMRTENWRYTPDEWATRYAMLKLMLTEELPALQLRPDEDVSPDLAAIRARAGLPRLETEEG